MIHEKHTRKTYVFTLFPAVTLVPNRNSGKEKHSSAFCEFARVLDIVFRAGR
jgi:hypothetical protein